MDYGQVKEQVTIAKALRSSFNNIQSDILKSSYLDNSSLIEMVRRAQEEHRLFNQIVNEIKEADLETYEEEILGRPFRR